jgi:DNA gyrase subunit B
MFNLQNPKLQDCLMHGANAGAELFLVEGDSAAAAVTMLRNKQLQAVLPMQGKPMNAAKSSLQKVLANPLFKALIDAIGAGVGDDFEVAKCRYSRIILLMDPDADGIHCGALMLLFFHRFMPDLLTSGRVEMVRPPVGEVTNTATKVTEYAYTNAQFMAMFNTQKNQANDAISNQAFESIKYRGLAGIQADKLAELCINPVTRKIGIMGMRDAAMALEIFGGV